MRLNIMYKPCAYRLRSLTFLDVFQSACWSLYHMTDFSMPLSFMFYIDGLWLAWTYNPSLISVHLGYIKLNLSKFSKSVDCVFTQLVGRKQVTEKLKCTDPKHVWLTFFSRTKKIFYKVFFYGFFFFKCCKLYRKSTYLIHDY